MATVDILGFNISSDGLHADVAIATEIVREGEKKARYVACANPHSLVVADDDPVFRTALERADILLPDGAGILVAAKILGSGLNERVAGAEFFLQFSEQAQDVGNLRYFFLGSTPAVLHNIVFRLKSEFPAIVVAGTYSPPFKETFSEEDNTLMIEAVNAARPDILWLGMTAPKQEKWVYENRGRLEVPLVGAIGAVFDFYSGNKERAPKWICDLGLEWLPRLLREPRRLWRRNLVSTPVFLYRIFRQKFAGVVAGR